MATVNRPREFREFESHTYHCVRRPTVRTSGCGPENEGSTPSVHPRPHRLMVRTLPSHGSNTGSNPVGVTQKEAVCQFMSTNVSNVIQNKH